MKENQDIRLETGVLTAETAAMLRATTHFRPLPVHQLAAALQNSLCTVTAFAGQQPVGMGRLVGDGAINWYVQDMIVHPNWQRRGVGTAVMQALLEHVRRHSLPGTTATIGLMAAEGKEGFYEGLGYFARPCPQHGAGMMMKLEVPG